MTKILPPILNPPEQPLARRHTPAAARYQAFSSCLRWEFGFICPFCLTHEGDHVPRGVQGSGVYSAEHRTLQSDDSEQINEYRNCIYCCRFCNRGRWTAPLLDSADRRLLDPTADTWSDHFTVGNDRIVARPGDDDAAYTIEAYKPNAPRQTDARRVRREKLTALMRRLSDLPLTLSRLARLAPQLEPDAAQFIVTHMAELRRAAADSLNEAIQDYALIPTDAPGTCGCDAAREIPVLFENQAVSPELP